jgi:cobalt/nickel transport system permease protein
MAGAFSLLGVHISDGVLTGGWLAAGFGLAGLLALAALGRDAVACRRSRRDRFEPEQIARDALLTAAFFVASLLHVKVGPTSVHLLLNGLLGVVLGWRAALAIPAGLLLQAALIGHGGFTALGVNSVVLTLPALLAGGLFAGLQRLAWVRHPYVRAALVAGSVFAWVESAGFSLALLATNRLGQLSGLETAPAVAFAFHPATLAAVLLLSLAAAWGERFLENAPEFPLGLLVGQLAVLATLLLNALVLVWGGHEDWQTLVLLVFIAHLPIAVVEGIILGFTVGFLARVKPELIGLACRREENQPLPAMETALSQGTSVRSAALGLAAAVLVLASPSPSFAHRLEAEYRILASRQVQLESWFETGDSASGARVQVFRPNDQLLLEGKLDDRGLFVFSVPEAETLKVVIDAGAGHRRILTIPGERLSQVGYTSGRPTPAAAPADSPSPEPFADRSPRISLSDVLVGVGFLLALAAFFISLRNAQQLKQLKARTTPPAEGR